jgi:hypothetical protein
MDGGFSDPWPSVTADVEGPKDGHERVGHLWHLVALSGRSYCGRTVSLVAATVLSFALIVGSNLPPRRSNAARITHHADPAVQRALTLLAQPLNPVMVIDMERARQIYGRTNSGAPPTGLIAFRAPDDVLDLSIYVNRAATVYRGESKANTTDSRTSSIVVDFGRRDR